MAPSQKNVLALYHVKVPDCLIKMSEDQTILVLGIHRNILYSLAKAEFHHWVELSIVNFNSSMRIASQNLVTSIFD